MKKPKTMTPAEFLKIRQHLGLTQEGLAQALGVRSNTIARWERGEVPILRVTELAMRYLAATTKKPR